ncbi:glutathione S-transferase family protein [Variovorax sp. YR216]|uniref:glutathione S-transferase family protein n=1 Tax=Variovorax sp. YR216 TaxID=1882828 RepID=UPI00089D6295|nr:glutathione S-transferase family protein [Variovorax sp. YR216]SEB23730.1 glutathione S-transferase [Variovorax sp. YR216]
MTELILHHYAFSPFSEKVRVALGLKGLSWRSVDIAAAPPRPLLSPLTGGYRRVPVLQIGADIYCDTTIILPTLERLHPTPSLYPAGCEGVARGLSFAWDRAMWVPTIGILSHFIGDQIPPEFIKDRKEGYLGFDMSKAAMAPELHLHRQRVAAQYAWLKTALADGRGYIFGDAPSALDLTCYHTIFLLRKNCPAEVDAMAIHGPLIPWFERVSAIGHGRPDAMSAEDAFATARDAKPAPVTHLAPDGDPGGLRAGCPVTVTPDDNARVPVSGTLVAASDSEVVILRRDPEVGDLHIHFPRLGFDVVAA